MKRLAPFLVAVLCISACGECGEAPAESAPQSSGQTVSGGGGGGGGGGDVIPLPARDKKKGDGTMAPTKSETAPVTAPEDTRGSATQQIKQTQERTAPSSTLATIMNVSPSDYDALIVKNKLPVLVVYGTSSCRPCAQVEFQLGALATEYAGKVAFARMDLSAPGAYELLPPGLRRLPLPAFAFYRDGSPLNIRQGLPVAAEASSRLKAWLKTIIDGRDVRL